LAWDFETVKEIPILLQKKETQAVRSKVNSGQDDAIQSMFEAKKGRRGEEGKKAQRKKMVHGKEVTKTSTGTVSSKPRNKE